MTSLLFIGVLSGFGFPLQTCVNVKLRKYIGSALFASFVSFGVSLLFLLCLLAIFEADIFPPLAQLSHEPLWIWIGGLCGVTVIVGNIMLFPRLGSRETVIFPILGQILMGLAIDHFGSFHAPEIPLTVRRFIGAAIVFLGCVAVSSGKGTGQSEQSVSRLAVGNLLPWRIMGVALGTLTSLQTAVNSYMGSVIHSPIKASVVSFVTGIIALSALSFWEYVKKKRLSSAGSHGGKVWWMWTGGFFGAAMVLANVYLGQMIGTGLTVIAVLTGSMLGGVVVDRFALLGAAKKPITPGAVLGIAAILAGIAIIRL